MKAGNTGGKAERVKTAGLSDRLLLQDADLFQAAITAVVIEAVADDKDVGDLEADPVDFDGDLALFLVQEDTDLDVLGAEFAQALDGAGEGMAGVEDVIDDDDFAALEGVA